MFLGGYSEIQNRIKLSFNQFYPEASFDNVDVSELVGMTNFLNHTLELELILTNSGMILPHCFSQYDILHEHWFEMVCRYYR